MGCLLLGFLVCRLGVMVVCVCYCCIPYGISNVSGCSLLLVCECDLCFVLGVFSFRRVMCCFGVHVGLAHCV